MQVGDRVWMKSKKCYCKIDFIEDDYVEVKMSNGVLVETSLSNLSPKSPDDEMRDIEAQLFEQLVNWYKDYNPFIWKLLSKSAPSFDTITNKSKIDLICFVSECTYEQLVFTYCDSVKKSLVKIIR